MKHLIALLTVTLAACGGGSMEVVNVATNNPMPPGFILGVTMDPLAPKSSALPFVTGPVVGPQVEPSPSIDPNICKPDAGGFVIGPCIPVKAPINWCSDGMVIGPCVPLPEPVCAQPGEVVVGPTPSCKKPD